MSVAERYVELCLRLARHDDELVDFYFGPKEISERVEREPPQDPAQLAADARSLAEETDSSYLRAQLRGLEIVARKLAGEHISYIRTYMDGYDLCRAWVGGDRARFKRLLTEQLTPADLV